MLTPRTDWSREEVRTCVAEYFKLLRSEVMGERFVKAQIYRVLATQLGRTENSIEFKFQNISAVLDVLGHDWLTGLAPLRNYQKLLAQEIEATLPDIIDFMRPETVGGFEDLAALYLEAPPERTDRASDLPEYMKSLVRKFDPVERDSLNRKLGELGEGLTFNFEKRFLHSIDRKDLAEQVRWVSKLDGDGAGYDILSYDDRGQQKYIEVKTTNGGNKTPFFISKNELGFSRKEPEKFQLRRLFNFRKQPRAFDINGPLEDYVRLTPENFRADFLK